MSDNELKVSAKAKTISNEETKKKEAELKASKKKQAEAKEKAEEAKEKAKKEAEEKKEKAVESKKESSNKKESSKLLDSDTEKLLAEGAAAAGGVLLAKKNKGFFSGFIIGAICGALLVGVLAIGLKDQLFGTVETTKETADEIIDETFTGYTAVDFQDAILGEAEQHQEIIVMEQPLEISTTITKAGLGGLKIFSKVKNINYAGTGVYTVDMKGFTKDNVSVDETDKKVTVKVPHSTLQYTNIDYDKVEFEDTDKGLLAFGDLSLTTEQQNTLEQSIVAAMKEKLETEGLYSKADEFAEMSVWNMFQPLVTAISPEYTLEVEFES